MPTIVNGRTLGVAQNGLFTNTNTLPIPGGRLWPEAAITWIAMRGEAVADGIQPAEFMPAGPNSSARSRAGQDWFWAHRPPPAARPYTSNHGWGIAVDVKSPRAVAWMHANAHRYGWSHDEGARVNEWWHWRYIGVSGARLRQIRDSSDPLRHLNKTERRWVQELDRLRRMAKNQKRLARRRALVGAIREQMAGIRARAEAESGGWNTQNRLKRYRTLKSRVT